MEIFGSINAVYVLVGSLILGASGGMLGSFAVLRKQGLLGDALAHAALPGIALAFLITQVKSLPVLLLGALISGLLGAFFIYILVDKSKVKMDSAMASVLSVFFGVGILLLTYIQKLPLASQSGLDSFLFGNAAALLKNDVMWMGGAFLIILAVVLGFWKELKMFTFDPMFGEVLGFRRGFLETLFMTIFVLSILMSLQAVGVILTAALFITPAVAALLWSDRLAVVVFLAALFGMVAGGGGAMISATYAKMPTGPVIVLFSTAIFFVSFVIAPKKGVLNRAVSFFKHSRKIRRENLLGQLYRDFEKGEEYCLVEDYQVGLIKAFVRVDGGTFVLNKRGLKEGEEIVRKHRLWETYLVKEMDIAPDHVHEAAHQMEHFIDDKMEAELKKKLKNPKKDPHGKPIK